jgi:beta-D-galactosyl-(1->4)-L-rhamnose phosphorylase
MKYWVSVRRALLRKKIERSGLGGYLSLTKDFPDFISTMDKILKEFDTISALHDTGAPELIMKQRIGVLHAWGKLRTWTLSGHFHETDKHLLIHVLEALSGLPLDVSFLSFEELTEKNLKDYDIIINAGEAGSAWSGGDYWKDEQIVATLTKWVYEGGILVGIGEPSAVHGYNTYLRMSHVFGVDIDNGERACHGRLEQEKKTKGVRNRILIPGSDKYDVVLTDTNAQVLAEGKCLNIVLNKFGAGKGVYTCCPTTVPSAIHFLKTLMFVTTGTKKADGLTSNVLIECAVFPNKIVFVNNCPDTEKFTCTWNGKMFGGDLSGYEMKEYDL